MTSGAAATPPTRGDLVVHSGLARGRVLFNRGYHWASHEAFEVAWRAAPEAGRAPIQGVIQAAAALHKLLVQANPTGAARLFDWAFDAMAAGGSAECGLELEPFIAQLHTWRARADTASPGAAEAVGLPRLEWRPEASRLEVDAIEAWRLPGSDASPGPVIVALHAGDVTGWGECRVSWEREGVWAGVTEALAPALLGEQFAAPSELPVIWSDVEAGPTARAGLEAAAWDLFARSQSTDLCTALGHAPRSVPLAGRVNTGRGADEPYPLRLARALAQISDGGFAVAVVPMRPNHDRELAGLIAGAPVPVVLDGAGSYGRAHADALRAIGEFGAVLLAEPFGQADVVLASRLRRSLGVPLSLPGLSQEHVESALALKAADAFHLDPGRIGLTEALRIVDFAADRGAGVWVAGTAATEIGAAADLALACRHGVDRACELPVMAAGRDQEPTNVAGGLAPQPGLGIGFEPTAAWLAQSVAYRRFQA